MLYKNVINLKGSKKINTIIKLYPLPFKKFIAMDVGTSVGGFLCTLIKYNAKSIYAIDSGYNILYWIFKQNIFIKNLEKIHINKVYKNYFHPKPQIVLIDVSFISIQKIIKQVGEYIGTYARLYILIKPQFEIFFRIIGKYGIIKLHYIHKMSLLNILYNIKNVICFSIIGFKPLYQSKNLEYWLVVEYKKKGKI